MIKVILSSYFRSGGTALWHVVRRGNPGYAHFYEPFHEDAMNKWYHYYNPYEPDKLHGLCGFGDAYNALPDTYKKELVEIKNEDGFLTNLDAVQKFLDIIHFKAGDSTIKINRCLWFLPQLVDNYGCKLIHLYRNPLNTLLSIFGFYVKEMYDCLCFLGLIDETLSGNIRPGDKMSQGIVVWLVLNEIALSTVEKYGGISICYDEIRQNRYVLNEIEEYSGLSMEFSGYYQPNTNPKYDDYFLESFMLRIDKLDLFDRYNKIYPVDLIDGKENIDDGMG